MPESTRAARDARRRLLRSLAEKLGHEFEDLGLLDRALCHASTGNQGRANYERLEFLGDSFLNFAVAEALFRLEPEIPEGKLTETRAQLVSRAPLARVARQLDLVNHLEVGKGLRDRRHLVAVDRAGERPFKLGLGSLTLAVRHQLLRGCDRAGDGVAAHLGARIVEHVRNDAVGSGGIDFHKPLIRETAGVRVVRAVADKFLQVASREFRARAESTVGA